MSEIWKNIKGFKHYQVSNFGRIRSITHRARIGKANYGIIFGKIIKPMIDDSGYLTVTLWQYNYRHSTFFVHRLVAKAFLPNPHHYIEVNHKDYNPENNKVSNLEWCSNWYNQHYGKHSQHLSKSHHRYYEVVLRKHNTQKTFADGMAAARWLYHRINNNSSLKVLEKRICSACRNFPSRIYHVYGYTCHYNKHCYHKIAKYQYRPKHVKKYLKRNQRGQLQRVIEFSI